MSKMKLLQSQAAVGALVTLRFTRGSDATGRISAITDEYVSLVGDNGVVTCFEDNLAGWELRTDADTTVSPRQTQTQSPPRSDPKRYNADAEGHASGDAQSLVRYVAEIVAKYKSLATLPEDAPLPTFTLDDTECPLSSIRDVRKQLDRAHSQFSNALKIREESRLDGIIQQTLSPLAKKYPRIPSIEAALGGVLLRLGRNAEAERHLRLAAEVSGKPEHWFGLAYACNDPCERHRALAHFFKRMRPADCMQGWMVCVSLTARVGAGFDLANAIQPCLGLPSDDPSRTAALEAIVFIADWEGRPDVVDAVAKALLANSSLPDDGWRKLFTSEHASHPTSSPPNAGATSVNQAPPLALTGKIASFGSQRFGFIDAEDQSTYFFRVDDVADETLRQHLLGGAWQDVSQVEFRMVRSIGHRYHRAVDIRTFQSVDARLLKARVLMKQSQYPNAIGCVREVLTQEPENTAALALEVELREKMKVEMAQRGYGLPKGDGPYAKAKRAQLVDRDFDLAITLYQRAIESRDHTASAVKDLAMLLVQMQRQEDAVELLASHRGKSSTASVTPYDSTLTHLLQGMGRYDAAVEILRHMLTKSPVASHHDLLRKIAWAQFKAERYSEAERTLSTLLERFAPDPVAENLLTRLKQGRGEGSYGDVSSVVDEKEFTSQGVSLSALAQFAIHECELARDLNALQEDEYAPKEIGRLTRAAGTLASSRPQDSAKCFLQAAAILLKSNYTADSQCHGFLSRYFELMAQHAVQSQYPVDVVRSLLLESLALTARESSEAWQGLLMYCASLNPFRTTENDNRVAQAGATGARDYRSVLRAIIGRLVEDNVDVTNALLDISNASEFASQELVRVANAEARIATYLLGRTLNNGEKYESVWRVRQEERRRHWSSMMMLGASILDRLSKAMTFAAMDEAITQLREGVERELGGIDRPRLSETLDTLEYAKAFYSAGDFEEKERCFSQVVQRAKAFCKTVTVQPTQFSHGALRPIVEQVRDGVEQQFAVVLLESAAKINASVLGDEHFVGQRGDVVVQCKVSNEGGCSPASNVRIEVTWDSLDGEGQRRKECVPVCDVLRGGTSEVCRVLVSVGRASHEAQAFPVSLRVHYVDRMGEACVTHERQCSVRLYDAAQFVAIENAYAPFAEGGAVIDKEMFVGRADLIERLKSSLTSDITSKCIVLYGQKRAGKSSVLEHLQMRLKELPDCIPVRMSLLDVVDNLDEAGFFYFVASSAMRELHEHASLAAVRSHVGPLRLEDLSRYASLRFHDWMAAVQKLLSGARDGRLRLVLLIDEFTEVYKQIKKGRVRPEFMKVWKAIVERRYFSSVLVGQDIMPAFKAEFANEFGVTEDVRITYLSDSAARQLVTAHIGADRFQSEAVDRLLSITAASPFYTMMFCNRLVDYVNVTRSQIITTADIEAVKRSFVHGNARLSKDKFDNLISAGDGQYDSGIDPEHTAEMCRSIAIKGQGGWCAYSQCADSTPPECDLLLEDLERREVVQRNEDMYRIQVGLFSDWLIAQG